MIAPLFSIRFFVFACYCCQGNVSRQEAVSMIPPLLLDVRPDSKVGIFTDQQPSSPQSLTFSLATTGACSVFLHIVIMNFVVNFFI